MKNRISTVIATAMLVMLTSGCCANMSNLWFGRGASCGLCNTFTRPQCGLCNGTPRLQCGLCNRIPRPQFGNVMQAPCATPQYASPAPTCPSAPCPAPTWQQPQWQAPTCQTCPAPNCGCNSNDFGVESYGEPCGSCHHSPIGDCGCGQTAGGYAGEVHDPYLSSESFQDTGTYNGMPADPYPGQVINGEVVVGPGYDGRMIEGQTRPGSSYPSNTYQTTPAPVLPDNFDPRPINSYPGQGNYQSRKFDTDGNKILWEEPLPAGSNAN